MNYSSLVTPPPEGTNINEYIEAYSKQLLDEKWKSEGVVDGRRVIFLRSAYRYEDVFSLSAVERRNLAGKRPDPSQDAADIVFRIGPVKVKENELILDPVLYTMVLPPKAYYKLAEEEYNDVTGEPVSSDDVLDIENKAVGHGQISATIHDIESNKSPEPIVDDLEDHLHTTNEFPLKIEKNSELAPYMEYSLIPGDYVAKVKGYFVLFGLAKPGIYRIISQGFGVRNYISLIECHVERV